jgi:cholesterol oxidase
MPDSTRHYDYDFIVVGSGFGGSVSALRLAEKGYRVAVMEMGRRWTPENLPRSNWYLHRWFWEPALALRGFFRMRYFRHVTILHGCAVGGGSITYAGTLLRPPDRVWSNGTWAGLVDWQREMPQHYDTASRMLGVIKNRILGPSDRLLQRVAATVGVSSTFYRTHVAIFQAPEGAPGGTTVRDPFFGGEGPDRTTCMGCGGCMMGCRHGARIPST